MHGNYATYGDFDLSSPGINITTTGLAETKKKVQENLYKINLRYFRSIAQNLTPQDHEQLSMTAQSWLQEIQAMLYQMGVPMGSVYYSQVTAEWQNEIWTPFISAAIEHGEFRFPSEYPATQAEQTVANVAQNAIAYAQNLVNAANTTTPVVQTPSITNGMFTSKNIIIALLILALGGAGYYFTRIKR
ncbi:MAG: hypothetical protein H7831_16195 [Magnetococcus sp. WYHC-3]